MVIRSLARLGVATGRPWEVLEEEVRPASSMLASLALLKRTKPSPPVPSRHLFAGRMDG